MKPHRIFTDQVCGRSPGPQHAAAEDGKWRRDLGAKFDRLGRDTADMIRLIQEYDQIGVAVRFLDDGITTEGTMGRRVVTILSAINQAERERILERTNEGRLEAKGRDVRFGLKPSIDSKRVLEPHREGLGATKIFRQLQISTPSVYKILGQKEEISGQN